MSDALAAFGNRVKALRLDAGLTQQQLAAAVDLSRTSITNIEGGRQEPGMNAIAAIAKTLGTTTDTLIGVGTAHEDPRTEQRIARLEDQVRRLAHVLNAAAGALGAFDLVIKETNAH